MSILHWIDIGINAMQIGAFPLIMRLYCRALFPGFDSFLSQPRLEPSGCFEFDLEVISVLHDNRFIGALMLDLPIRSKFPCCFETCLSVTRYADKYHFVSRNNLT